MVNETLDDTEAMDSGVTVKNPQGDFIDSLIRSNTKIRRDRAEQIGRKTATAYKPIENIIEIFSLHVLIFLREFR